jgi:hypothetical protein
MHGNEKGYQQMPTSQWKRSRMFVHLKLANYPQKADLDDCQSGRHSDAKDIHARPFYD